MFESTVSVSVIVISVSTAVVPSATSGVVSSAAYVGVWSFASVTETVTVLASAFVPWLAWIVSVNDVVPLS